MLALVVLVVAVVVSPSRPLALVLAPVVPSVAVLAEDALSTRNLTLLCVQWYNGNNKAAGNGIQMETRAGLPPIAPSRCVRTREKRLRER